MEKYGDLFIPPEKASIGPSAIQRQNKKCDGARCWCQGENLFCSQCLFATENLGRFIEWETDCREE